MFTVLDQVHFKHPLGAIALIHGGDSLLAVYKGSKIILTTLNTKPSDSVFRRAETRIRHNFNFFRPTTVMLLEGDAEILVQDKAKQTLIFNITTDKEKAISNVVSKFRGNFQHALVFDDKVVGL